MIRSILLLTVLFTLGCSDSGSTSVSPFRANFNITTGSPLPYPIDLYFSGSSDGTLNIPASTQTLTQRDNLNHLDGFSTTSRITATFSKAIDATSISGDTVHLIEVALDASTHLSIHSVCRSLVFGTDFSSKVSSEGDTKGLQLEIIPLKPLSSGSGPLCNGVPLQSNEGIGYVVVLTTGLKDTDQESAVADTDFQTLKDTQADCALVDTSLIDACLITKSALSLSSSLGVDSSSIALAWSFSTVGVQDTLKALSDQISAQPISATNTGQTVTHADIYAGTLQIPYYMALPANANDRTAVTSHWRNSVLELTRLNPVPTKTADIKIPLLVTVPNASSPSAGVKPSGGWPAVIFMPALTSDRTSMLSIATAYANAGFVVASIDLAFHGVTSASNALHQAWNGTTHTGERTFDLDIINNTTLASGNDGLTDPSGFNALSMVLENPLGFRDSMRQTSLDVVTLAKSLSSLDLTGDSVGDINPNKIHYASMSGGSILGAPALAQTFSFVSAYLNVPGGGVIRTLFDSNDFGLIFKSILSQSSLGTYVTGTSNYENYLRDLQNVVDSADALNFIASVNQLRPLLLTQVKNDTTVPNSATQRLVTAASLSKTSAAGTHNLSVGSGQWVHFISGAHSSLLSSTASAPVTSEMQSEAVSLAASGGNSFQISDSSLLEP